MKVYSNVLAVLVLFFVASQALDESPTDVIPYCIPVVQGISTDTYGTPYNIVPTLCDNGNAIAMFLNGQNTGYNLTYALSDYSDRFWDLEELNTTQVAQPSVGVVWDLGADVCYGGIGITDGTYDTVDGAMSIVFDFNAREYENSAELPPLNITTTCSSNSVSFSTVVNPSGLVNRRTFYFPNAPSESWARVVDEVTNPTDADITVSVAYFNNLGSDYGTLFIGLSNRYCYATEKDGELEMRDDNLVSFHWSSVDGVDPDGFTIFTDYYMPPTPRIPLTTGNDDVVPYWNVTIPASETMTFMFVMNQGGIDKVAMNDSVMALDANPLKLYFGMTAEQLNTLYNFNPCSTTFPALPLPPPSTECTSDGGSAEYDLSALFDMVSLGGATVTVHDKIGTTVATSAGTSLSVPAGTYDVKFNFAQCSFPAGEVVVTCTPPAPVAAPMVTPAPVTTAPVQAPVGKTSSAESLIGLGVATVLALLAAL